MSDESQKLMNPAANWSPNTHELLTSLSQVFVKFFSRIKEQLIDFERYCIEQLQFTSQTLRNHFRMAIGLVFS